MDLDQVTAEIRPRAEWEAVDLGMALTREHLPQLLKIWGLTVLPISAVVIGASAWLFNVLYGIFLLWWLKPLFERVVLFYLSRALFGDTPAVREAVKQFPRQMMECWKLILSGIALTAFSWYAVEVNGEPAMVTVFSMLYLVGLVLRSKGGRSFLMPVQVLEKLTGAAFRSRCRVLSRRGGVSVSLTMMCSLLETFLTVHLFFLIYILTPEGSRYNLENLEQGLVFVEVWLYWLMAVIYFISMSVVSLFYVGAGFGLYLNARTWIEGWDVELGFKRLGQRLSAGLSKAGVFILCGLFLTGGQLAKATEIEGSSEIEKVLAHDDFKENIKTLKTWEPDSSSSSSSTWSGLMEGLGLMFFWGVTIFLLVGLGWLIYKNRHLFSRDVSRGRKDEKKPEVKTVAGLNVDPESLPDDILEAAREAWAAGDAQLAMSLLYRGAISKLVGEGVMLPDESATERDCLSMVKAGASTEVSGYFAKLTRVWMSLAYGRQRPRDSEVENLWSGWPFQERGGA